jgi:hypothetical protein
LVAVTAIFSLASVTAWAGRATGWTMIALVVLAAAIANVTLVVLLAERFGSEGVHTSARHAADA